MVPRPPWSQSAGIASEGVTYTVLSHTADTGIEAEAESFAELIEVLATGMFEIMGAIGRVEPTSETTVEVSRSTPEETLVDSLSELLFHSEVEDVHYCSFSVDELDDDRIIIRARGLPIGEVEPTGPPIKAVTYHDVSARETNGRWFGRVYFDV